METICLIKKEFDDLPEYSTSNPTGTTIGKVWKRKSYVFKIKGKGDKIFSCGYLPSNVELIEVEWFHCQYLKSKEPGYIDIKLKQILIVGTRNVDKVIQRFNERKII